MAQELTAAQRDACMGDYEKFCKGTVPGGGRSSLASPRNDKLTPACKKVLAEARRSRSIRRIFTINKGKSAFIAACRHCLLAFAATMTLESRTASAVVCADGVVRAACAGPRGAVVVKKPVPVVACKWVWVNSVKVRRCV